MSEIKEFKTESKRLLDLMTNSIYTNKEIFLRELISNASDAIDKYHYLSLNDEKLIKVSDYQIFLSVNKEDKSISIEDNGIGMTYDEVINNLGTIAKSGSLEFLEKLKEEQDQSKKENIDIIGQFGVGFYSAFMVSNKVVVETKSPYSEKGYRFSSTGEDTYSLDEIDKVNNGTKITLFLKDDTEDEKYSEYLEQYTIEDLVKKYSDYVRYPIKMNVVHSHPKLDKDGKPIENEYEEETKLETLNSMIPLWKRNKNEVTPEQLNEFYKNKFMDYEDPLLSLFVSVEGLISYNALVFIPAHAPFDLYSDKYKKGLQLYSKGVFIQEQCDELIPDYLRFVKGLVDSADLSLNISRELLQQSSELKKIATNIEKKIIQELTRMMSDDKEKYEKFFDVYGVNLKFGIYESYGAKKDTLQDLLLYPSVNNEKKISLADYINNLKENQDTIYFAAMKTKEEVLAMPQMDRIKKLGYDVLILKDDVDEFVLNILQEYKEKKFKSINQGDLDVLSKEEEDKIEKIKEDNKSLLEEMKDALKDEVDDVIISKRLVDSPVCLVSGDGVSFEMEKVISKMPTNDKIKANRILEINPQHELFKAIENLYEKDKESLKDYATLLYNQALLMEGLPIKNPVEFSNKMVELMIKSAK